MIQSRKTQASEYIISNNHDAGGIFIVLSRLVSSLIAQAVSSCQ